MNQCFNKAHHFPYGKKCPKFAIHFCEPIFFYPSPLQYGEDSLKKRKLNNACLYILQTNKKWETSTDIDDITGEQIRKSPVLYDYLKNTFEKINDESQDLVKRALSEFITLTGASYDLPTDKKEKGGK